MMRNGQKINSGGLHKFIVTTFTQISIRGLMSLAIIWYRTYKYLLSVVKQVQIDPFTSGDEEINETL